MAVDIIARALASKASEGGGSTLPTYPTDTENKNYILQLTNGVLTWTLLEDGNTGEY